MSDQREAGDARRSPARPFPGSSGRLSTGPSRSHDDRVDPQRPLPVDTCNSRHIDALGPVWDVGVAGARVPLAGGHLSDAVEPFWAELLRIEVGYQGCDAFIVVEGAFDTTAADRFVASVVDALKTHPEAIVVDANGLTFIDSSGLTALLRSRAAAGVAGVGFRISERSPALRRAIDAAGIEDLLADE
jgi:anti-sigma B factor antagonist